MTAALDQELASYPPGSVTARVLGVLASVVPGGHALPHYTTAQQAASAVMGGVPDDVLARATELLADARIDQALFAARTIDTGDTGLTIVTGVRSALALFFGDPAARANALGQQQRADAAVKAFGLAYVVTRLLPVKPAERLELVLSVPAGHELLRYFGAIEIAVPFAQEVRAADGKFVANLVAAQGRQLADKVLAVVGREGAADAEEMLSFLTGALDRAAVDALPHTAALADKIKSLLPISALPGDLFEIVAAGVDALPSYRYLVARLAVEASLALAKHEKMPDVPLPSIGASAATVAAPPPPPIPDGLRTLGHGAPAPAPVAVAPIDAPPVPDALVPSDEDGHDDDTDEPPAPPEPEPEPRVVWPTEAMPEAERLRGFYLGPGEAWRIWTVEGVFTDAPWADPTAVDWDAHRAAGHRVARYRRAGETLTTTELDGRTTRAVVLRDDRSIRIDGDKFDRTDWDLTGRAIAGRWDGPDGPLVMREDGAVALGVRAGKYALGVGRITFTWEDGAVEVRTFLTDLRPTSRAPAVLYVGGRRYDSVR